MVANYSGLYEEGDIEHINVPPVPSQRSCLTLICTGRDPTYLPTRYKKGHSAESGEPVYGTEIPPFLAGKNWQKPVNRIAILAPSIPTKKVTAHVHDGIP